MPEVTLPRIQPMKRVDALSKRPRLIPRARRVHVKNQNVTYAFIPIHILELV